MKEEKAPNILTLDDYQERAMSTCMDSSDTLTYMLNNLMGEVGEFASKLAKAERKGLITYSNPYMIAKRKTNDNSRSIVPPFVVIHDDMTEEGMRKEEERINNLKVDLMYELGDILWQVSGLCHQFGWSLNAIAHMNLAKLSSRKERNQIDGEGDHR